MSMPLASSALYTAAQVREIDRKAIASGTSGIVLMRRAAEAAWQAAQQKYASLQSIVVLCGAGNNGGDGYLFARAARAAGKRVEVFAFAESKGDAATARQALLGDGVHIRNAAEDLEALPHCLAGADLVVDALLGTGLAGAPRPAYADVIEKVNQLQTPVLALDIPSGICADSGRLLGEQAVAAQLTVTFIAYKRGLFTDAATEHVGELVFASLGVTSHSPPDAEPVLLCNQAQLLSQLPQKRANHYKNRSGHVLVVGGDYGMAGAVILAGRAALRCGSGLVTLATRPEHVSAVVAAQPELMAHGIEKTAQLDALLARADVVVIGPGLGQSAWSRQLLERAAQSAVKAVVDADALNLVSAEPKLMPVAEALLTPHPGEARRLAIGLGVDTSLDRFSLAQALRDKSKKNVLLKGAGTIVAAQDQTRLCQYGHPVLATAGSGDVLSGIVAALMAQGMSSGDSAALAACLHGHAGEYWASENGAYGMLAGDIIAAVVARMNGAGINAAKMNGV
ncbi:MAG: NAD(P)H-hydrate dehydratase [Gammaproteobacteria bacterium]|nr:NAD(P)H-hydrate dehydratase [Gammaproteobacteria bacterium]MBT8150196.1 NAD(P)H-hydrate dehydratase [Gammaproteobacteria bacterium]NND38494.1 NAD(P)H-hydrate dehydratase [Pseudomonadales bacterium]NNM11980.1 NAD(P)H-hydrate dehydratase [Pseudomonadales bacterium]RZV57972.1 MAG: NAD(P)H-hydrate dehydratase [Pseudomonadales bacterium]